MSTQSEIAEKKEKALLELMGPKSDIEDRAKLAIAKHFDNNGNKVYYMDRRKTDKFVYKSGMRKSVY